MTKNDTMGGERKVDVVLIMRHMVRMHEIEGGGDRYDEGHEAIAAVAELIGAADEASDSMHGMIDALGDDEFMDDDNRAFDRLNAILARIGGTP